MYCLLLLSVCCICAPTTTITNTPCRLAEQARDAEKARREAAAKAAEYEAAAREELERLRARRAAAKKVCVGAVQG